MKQLFFTILFSTNIVFAATELIQKEIVPVPEVANLAEAAINKHCQPSAAYTTEMRVRRYEYRKSKQNDQVILHHTVVVVFDYGGDFIDFVRVRVDEKYPQGDMNIGAIESPDICLN